MSNTKHRVLDNQVIHNPNYDLGVDTIYRMLNRESISDSSIAALHGECFINYFKYKLDEMYVNPRFVGGGVARPLNPNAPTEIADSRRLIEKNVVYQNMHQDILSRRLPDISAFRYFFESDAEKVQGIYELFFYHNIEREAGIPAAAHLNRVACTLWNLMRDRAAKHIAAIAGACHDVGEDILPIHRDEKGKLYGLNRHDEFFKKYVPESAREDIEILTNYYHMFIKQAVSELKFKGRSTSFSNITSYLNSQYHDMSKTHTLKGRLEKLLEIFTDKDTIANIDIGNAEESMKRFVYPVYLQDELALCVKRDSFLSYDEKCVDVTDNGHGKSDNNMRSRMKNMVKRADLVYYGDVVNNKLPDKNWLLDTKMREVEADVIEDAVNFLVEKLVMRESVQDYLKSMFNSILVLQPVLYIGKPSTYYLLNSHKTS